MIDGVATPVRIRMEDKESGDWSEMQLSDVRYDAQVPDELFAGLRRELGEGFRTSIRVLCPRPEWKHLIRAALTHRAHRKYWMS